MKIQLLIIAEVKKVNVFETFQRYSRNFDHFRCIEHELEETGI